MTQTEIGELSSSQKTNTLEREVDLNIDIDEEREEQDGNEGNERKSKALKHCTKLHLTIKKGKRKGDVALHFQCKYCKQAEYAVPGSYNICATSILRNARNLVRKRIS